MVHDWSIAHWQARTRLDRARHIMHNNIRQRQEGGAMIIFRAVKFALWVAVSYACIYIVLYVIATGDIWPALFLLPIGVNIATEIADDTDEDGIPYKRTRVTNILGGALSVLMVLMLVGIMLRAYVFYGSVQQAVSLPFVVIVAAVAWVIYTIHDRREL